MLEKRIRAITESAGRAGSVLGRKKPYRPAVHCQACRIYYQEEQEIADGLLFGENM